MKKRGIQIKGFTISKQGNLVPDRRRLPVNRQIANKTRTKPATPAEAAAKLPLSRAQKKARYKAMKAWQAREQVEP